MENIGAYQSATGGNVNRLDTAEVEVTTAQRVRISDLSALRRVRVVSKARSGFRQLPVAVIVAGFATDECTHTN